MDSIDVVVTKDHIEIDIENATSSMTISLPPDQTLFLAKKLQEAAKQVLQLHQKSYYN